MFAAITSGAAVAVVVETSIVTALALEVWLAAVAADLTRADSAPAALPSVARVDVVE
jgi:hypothetical protein